jgi:hypothetical protein
MYWVTVRVLSFEPGGGDCDGVILSRSRVSAADSFGGFSLTSLLDREVSDETHGGAADREHRDEPGDQPSAEGTGHQAAGEQVLNGHFPEGSRRSAASRPA